MLKDQATNLRFLADRQRDDGERYRRNSQQMVIVTGGKGGVGKSFVSLHLSHALAGTGKKVLLVDSNLRNPSLHILTNTDPLFPLNYWIEEAIPIERTGLIEIGQNLDFLPNIPPHRHRKNRFREDANMFLELLEPLCGEYDYLILDTETGLNTWNLSLILQAGLTVLVSISDPTSVIDTYTFIKASFPHLRKPHFALVVNQVIEEKSGFEAYTNLNQALNNFLDYRIELLSLIPFDLKVKRAGLAQQPLWQFSKNSKVLPSIQKMAERIFQMQENKLLYKSKQLQEVNL